MCKIYGSVEENLKFSPACECQIVVCGDTFQGNTMEHTGERGTNGVAFSVRQFPDPSSFGKTVNHNKQNP